MGIPQRHLGFGIKHDGKCSIGGKLAEGIGVGIGILVATKALDNNALHFRQLTDETPGPELILVSHRSERK